MKTHKKKRRDTLGCDWCATCTQDYRQVGETADGRPLWQGVMDGDLYDEGADGLLDEVPSRFDA